MPLAPVSASTPAIGVAASPAGNGDTATPEGFGGMVDAVAGKQPAPSTQPTAPNVPAQRGKTALLSSIALDLPAGTIAPDTAATVTLPPRAVPSPDVPADTASARPLPDAADPIPVETPASETVVPVVMANAAAEASPPSVPAPPGAGSGKAKAPLLVGPKGPAEKDGGDETASIAPAVPDSVPPQPALTGTPALAASTGATPAPAASLATPAAVLENAPLSAAPDRVAQTGPSASDAFPTAAAHATAQTAGSADLPAAAPPRQDGLPTTLFSQVLGQQTPVHALLSGTSYAPDKPTAATSVVRAQAGQIGKDMGAVIARQIVEGREQMTVRLNPPEMGRVDVRLAFDHGGGLRAVMATESPAAMDLLRRDVGDLNRALSDAGVRTDAQSFRFDSRHSGGGFAQSDHPRQNAQGQAFAQSRHSRTDHLAEASADSAYRPLRASGGIDMIA